MEEQKEIRIDVIVRKLERKDGSGSFLTYKGFTKRGKLDLKFTKEVKDVPTKNGYIYVESENVNVNRTGRFPVIWVKKIEKFEEINFTQKIEDYFAE